MPRDDPSPMPDEVLTPVLMGLHELLDALQIMDAKLDQVLEAATVDPPESELPEILKRVARAIEEQTAAMRSLEVRISELPERAARAVADGEI